MNTYIAAASARPDPLGGRLWGGRSAPLVMGGRIGGDGRLLPPRETEPQKGGGLLSVAGSRPPSPPRYDLPALDAVAICRSLGLEGVYADYPRAPRRLLQVIGEALERAGLLLYANPPCPPPAIAVISPCPEEAGFEASLRSAGSPFAVDLRVAGASRRLPGGERRELCRSELAALAASGAGRLCRDRLCRFTADAGTGELIFFDDADTLRRRGILCREYGAAAVFAIDRELADVPGLAVR